MDDPIIIQITTSSEKEAESIGRILIDEKLAACFQIVPAIRSLYRWKGAVCDDTEFLAIIKSRHCFLKKVIDRVKEIHSYEVPEVVAIPIIGGSEEYIKWMEESIS